MKTTLWNNTEFPYEPVDGQVTIINGIIYYFDAPNGAWNQILMPALQYR